MSLALKITFAKDSLAIRLRQKLLVKIQHQKHLSRGNSIKLLRNLEHLELYLWLIVLEDVKVLSDRARWWFNAHDSTCVINYFERVYDHIQD